MYISKVNLKNFGPFDEYSITFKSTGINLITGYAGSGKTQFFGAFIYILYGKKALGTSDINEESSVILLTEQQKNKTISRIYILFK